MKMDRDRIVGKIRALLAKTTERGCTEAEAVQAALAAQRLIAQHDVTQDELHRGRDRADEPIGPVKATYRRRWNRSLMSVVAEAFRCRCYTDFEKSATGRSSTAKAAFYGYESDAAAAVLVYDRLRVIGHRLAADAAARWEGGPRGRIAYDSFAFGFVEGVRTELEKQTVALALTVPLAVREAYDDFSAGFGTIRSRPVSIAPSLKAEGEAAGRDAVRAGRIGAADAAALPGGARAFPA